MRYKTVIAMAVAACGAGASIAASVGAATPSDAGPLGSVRSGQWDLRSRDGAMSQTVCVRSGSGLIQLKHLGKTCDRIILEQSASSILVQYTCKGSGFGRTRIRRETPQLLQLETQGIADGLPFDYSVEGRWVGECARSPG